MQPGPERLLVLAERMEIPWAWSADAPPAGWRPWHRPRARGAGVAGLDGVVESLIAARRAPRIAPPRAELNSCPYYAARWWSAAAAYAAEQAEADIVRRVEQKQELAADAAVTKELIDALAAREAAVSAIGERMTMAADVGTDAGFVDGFSAAKRVQRVARLLQELQREMDVFDRDIGRARAPLKNNRPGAGVRTFAYHAAHAFGHLTGSPPRSTGRCLDFVRAAAVAAGAGDGETSWAKQTAAALEKNAAGIARYDIFAGATSAELIETQRKTPKVPPTLAQIRARWGASSRIR